MNQMADSVGYVIGTAKMIPTKVADFLVECTVTHQLHRMIFECSMRTENRDRLQYGEYMINIRRYKRFFKIDHPNVNAEKKDNSRSGNHRAKGNKLHNEGKYIDAIVAYNQSICFAATAEKLCLGYANRSATYFEMARFVDCQENIALARECVGGGMLPTENLHEKLTDRERKCAGKENAELFSDGTVLSLSYDPNPDIPFLVDRLGIKKDGSKMLVYAREYIEADTVIFKEDMINILRVIETRYEHCHYCMRPNYNLIPCPNCACAMYCNANCMSRANEEFHNWECPIIDFLYRICDEPMLISFRLLLKMLNEFKDYAELAKYWKEVTANHQLEWYSIKPNEYDKRTHFRMFHSHYYKLKHFKDTILNFSIRIAIFKREILWHSDLKRFFVSDEQKALFGEIMLHHLLTFIKIMKPVGGRNLRGMKAMYGIFCPLITEMKVSENPNVLRVYSRSSFFGFANRPIQKGEILRINEEADDELAGTGIGLMPEHKRNSDNNSDEKLLESLLFNAFVRSTLAHLD